MSAPPDKASRAVTAESAAEASPWGRIGFICGVLVLGFVMLRITRPGANSELFAGYSQGGDAWMSSIRTLVEEGEAAEGIRRLTEERPALRPWTLGEYLLLSEAWAELDDEAQARAALAQAEQEDPEHPEVFLQACILDLDYGEPEDAVSACTRSIELGRANPEYHAFLNRGLAWMELGRLDEAEEDLLHCQRIDPTEPDGFLEAARLWAVHGDLEASLRDLEAGMRLGGELDPAVLAGPDEPFRQFADDPDWQAFLTRLRERLGRPVEGNDL